MPREIFPVSSSTWSTFTRTRSPARTCCSSESLIRASANMLMWHRPDRPEPSRVTNTP